MMHDYRIEIVVDREQLDGRGMVCDLDAAGSGANRADQPGRRRNLEEIRPAEAEAVTVEVFARLGCMTPLARRSSAGAPETWPTSLGNSPSRSADTATGASTHRRRASRPAWVL